MSKPHQNCKCFDCRYPEDMPLKREVGELLERVAGLEIVLRSPEWMNEIVRQSIEFAPKAVLAAMGATTKRGVVRLHSVDGATDACPAAVRIVAAPDLMPVRATEGAAGFDLKAAIAVELEPGARVRIPTGVRIALPPGYEAQVRPRSGLSLRGLDVAIGTVDSDYRGEVGVVVVNNHGGVFGIGKGDRIAQMVVCRLPEVRLELVDALDETARGEGGFGSTGSR